MNLKTIEELKAMNLEEIEEYEKVMSDHAMVAWHVRRYMELEG